MLTNLALLGVELLVLGGMVVFLHARSRRYGLAPLLIYLSGLVAILHTLGPTALFLDVGSLHLEVSNVTLVPVILMSLLILYRMNGTAVARVTILGIVGLSFLVLLIQLARATNLDLGARPGIAGLSRQDPIFGAEWRITVSSIAAFTVSLTTVAVVDQALLNRIRTIPRWVTPGVALLVAALVDDLVFRTAAFGARGYIAAFPGGFPGKALGALALWPVAVGYLRHAAPQVMRGDIPDSRPALDIVFGTYGQRDHALRTTAAQLTTVISQAPIVMFAVDARGIFTLVEGAGLHALDLHPGEVLGKSVFDLFPESEDAISAALQGRAVRDVLHVRGLTWDASFTPMVQGGVVTGVTGVATDITAKVRAEAALDETERRFRSTFEEAAVGLAHVDLDGKVILSNRVLSHLLHQPEGRLTGRELASFLHPEARGDHASGLGRLIDGSEDRHTAELRLLRADGAEVWVNTSTSLVHDDAGSPLYYIVVVEDLTARRNMEEQLRQALKMEVVGQLTGGVAHDFNNLLTVVITGIEMALVDEDSPQDRRDSLDHALRAARRGAELTQRLLAFSRRQALQPVPLAAAELITSVRTLLARLVPETIQVRTEVDEDAGWCEADRAQIESALLNLALNARDAMPDGGTLTLGARRAEVVDDDLPTPNAAPGSYVCMSVRDEGVGIPPEVQQHVFEPFFSTKGVSQGSGLGLSMVYGFVTQSGGFVTLSSEVGRGTVVSLYLPATPVHAA